jgi:hypothetical protein
VYFRIEYERAKGNFRVEASQWRARERSMDRSEWAFLALPATKIDSLIEKTVENLADLSSNGSSQMRR